MNACFIGHRTIEKTESLVFLLRETIITLINSGVATFLFGSMSNFDKLSWEIVTELQREYPHIKRIYVRSIYPTIDKFYEEYILKFYEDSYFPPRIKNAGKYSYVERNYEMIKNSTYCIFYYNKNYIPISKKQPKNDMVLQKTRKSGTKIAYEYAVKKKKIIINLYKD